MENKVTFERLAKILADQEVLERFLSQLLGRVVTLLHPPKLAIPWSNIHYVPDIRAVGVDGAIYCIEVAPKDETDCMAVMEKTVRECEGVTRELHVIMICQAPTIAPQQSYTKIGPAILNHPSGEVVPMEGASAYQHVLTAGCEAKTAPEEIEQVLGVLGRPGEGTLEEVGEVMPLLAAMMGVAYQWLWLDQLRLRKKAAFARSYSRVVSEQHSRDVAEDFAWACADEFFVVYTEEKLKSINALPGLLIDALHQQGTTESPIEIIAGVLVVPVEVVEGVLGGKEYTVDDFRRYYPRR